MAVSDGPRGRVTAGTSRFSGVQLSLSSTISPWHLEQVSTYGSRPASAFSGGPRGSSLPPSQRPRDSGRKLFGGAVAMLTIGVPFGLAGTVMLGLCPSCAYIHLPLLLPGIGLITGGAIALKRSKQRENNNY